MGADDEQTLVKAVTELTGVVRNLDQLLRDEYPRRSEVERRFVSKLAAQRNVTRMVLIGIITVISCYVINVGAYSVCFVGDLKNPTFCTWLPGYDERVDRSEEVNRIHREQSLRIERLERELGLPPIKDPKEN